MTTRSGRAATPCEVSEPAGTQAPRVWLTPARWGEWGRGAHQPKGKEVGGAQFPTSCSQVGYKWSGRRKLWGGVDASREFWRDAGGRFLERGATLVASYQSTYTERFLRATLACESGRGIEGEAGEGCPRALWLPAGVGRTGRTCGWRRGSARAHTLSRFQSPRALAG